MLSDVDEDGHITPSSFGSGLDKNNFEKTSTDMTPLAMFSKSMRDLQGKSPAPPPKTFVFPIPELVETLSPVPEANVDSTSNFAGNTFVKPQHSGGLDLRMARRRYEVNAKESWPIAATNPSILLAQSITTIKSPTPDAWPFARVSPTPVSSWPLANKPPVFPPVSPPPNSSISPLPDAWPFAHKPPSSNAKFPSIHGRTLAPSSLIKVNATPLLSSPSLPPQPTISLLPPMPTLLQQSTATKSRKVPSQLFLSSSSISAAGGGGGVVNPANTNHNQLHSAQQLSPNHQYSSPLGSPVHNETIPLFSPVFARRSPPSLLASPVFQRNPPHTRIDASPVHVRRTPHSSPVHTRMAPPHAISPAHIRRTPLASPVFDKSPAHTRITPTNSPEHGQNRRTPFTSPGHSRIIPFTSPSHVRRTPSLLARITSPTASGKAALLSPMPSRRTPLASPMYPMEASICDDIRTVPLEPGRFDAASIYSVRSIASLRSRVAWELTVNQENEQVLLP